MLTIDKAKQLFRYHSSHKNKVITEVGITARGAHGPDSHTTDQVDEDTSIDQEISNLGMRVPD